ncbi:MAG: hypothetical protein Q7V48_03720 [Deltaproteobacteria bacterium]|nr:hypothetical protein [Deltaproteobacteria bacterium]
MNPEKKPGKSLLASSIWQAGRFRVTTNSILALLWVLPPKFFLNSGFADYFVFIDSNPVGAIVSKDRELS